MIHRLRTQPIIQSLPECPGVLYAKKVDTFCSCVLTNQPGLIIGFPQMYKKVSLNTKTDKTDRLTHSNSNTHTHTNALLIWVYPASPPLSNLSNDITTLDWVSVKWSLACMREGENWRTVLFFMADRLSGPPNYLRACHCT